MGKKAAAPPSQYGTTREDERAMTAAKRRHLERANKAATLVPPDGAALRAQRRWVVLDLDNVLCSLRSSKLLYESAPGATGGEDLRLDIAQFTALLRRGTPRSFCELHAVYASMNPTIASVFQDCGWTLSRVNSLDMQGVSRRDVIKQLVRRGIERADRDSVATATTLVLASGDGDLVAPGDLEDVSDDVSSRDGLQTLFRATPGLRVEIHSWLHAFHNAYFDLQRRFPSHVRVHALNDHVAEVVTTANDVSAAVYRPPPPLFAYKRDATRPSLGLYNFRTANATARFDSRTAPPTPFNTQPTHSSTTTDDALILSVVVVAIAFVVLSLWLHNSVIPHIQ